MSSASPIVEPLLKVAKMIVAPVVVFSSSTCPFCTKAKAILKEELQDRYSQAIIFELNEEVGGRSLMPALVAMTGRKTVPNIFIGGKPVGGCNELEKLVESGQLRSLLKEVGLIPIAKGERIPSTVVRLITWDNAGKAVVAVEDVSKFLTGKRVVIVGVPAAFSPTCSEKHLPGFIAKVDEFSAKGVDAIICMSVNDHFVMNAWGKELKAGVPKIIFCADGNGEFTAALGMSVDSRKAGMGMRSKRFAMLVRDGVVEEIAVDAPMTMKVSTAESIMSKL